MLISMLRIIALLCTAAFCGKLMARIKLPAILGWLLAGILFGPCLAGIVTTDITDTAAYKIFIKFAECFAGVMIGREIVFRKIRSSGKQVIGITLVQSLGTFAFVSLVFGVVLLIKGLPLYLAFIFGGIALATAPAPALSIVHEYRTKGPVTDTLIPLAAIDDIIGVLVFFTVISLVGGSGSGAWESLLAVLGMVVLPFAVGGLTGAAASFVINRAKDIRLQFGLLLFFLCLSAGLGLALDLLVFHSFRLNYLLTGMTFSAGLANLVPEDLLQELMRRYNPLLSLTLILVIVNLGLPLDYRAIAGAGLFTAIYILSRAGGKIGGAFLGGKITKAAPTVTKYLGFTLLPHSGVSLVFTGIAVTTLSATAPELASLVSGTIVAAAVINEIIAVITAKFAFKWAGEINTPAA